MHFIKPFLAPKARAQRQRSDFGFNFGNFGDFGNPAEAVPPPLPPFLRVSKVLVFQIRRVFGNLS
jgi:hypothetical protein